MNRNCHGDHFTAEGARRYRCSYDGAVSLGVENDEACPSCGRIVDGVDHGVLEVETQVKSYVTLPDGRQVILSTMRTQVEAAPTVASTQETFTRTELYEINDALNEVIERMCHEGQTKVEIEYGSLKVMWDAQLKVQRQLLGPGETPGQQAFLPIIEANIAKPKVSPNRR